ncbi:MAG: peroxiredoxin-like family protein [Sarcina sp.]
MGSKNLLKKGPLVINFYRGGWCPYCNLELRAYMEVLDEIKKLGANLIAISPEIPDQSLNTIEKNQLEFLVLSDIDNKVAKEFGLVFKISNELNELYKSFGINLEESQGKKSLELPMAATYVVSREGKIVKAFVKEDYKERLDPKVALESLRNL